MKSTLSASIAPSARAPTMRERKRQRAACVTVTHSQFTSEGEGARFTTMASPLNGGLLCPQRAQHGWSQRPNRTVYATYEK